jgi:AraC-like DNA-binding protein
MKSKNQIIKSFKIPFLSEVEAITGKHINNEFRRHIHKTYIIGIVEQGKRIISYSNNSSTITKGEIFIINPKQVHSCRSESSIGHSYKLLSISPSVMRLTASHISERHEELPIFSRSHIKDNKLSQKLLKLFDILRISESDIQIESNFYDFIASFLISYSKTALPIPDVQNQNDSIEKVCMYIYKHYADNLSLRELSSIACLSPFHFQREFKRYIGITPHEYLNDFRIGKAKKLLLENNELVDIANLLGFSDQSHFSRIFRKTVGVTPGTYRASNKNC